MIAAPHSRIYRGELRHRRFLPRAHAFRYRLWMAWLDLDELPELFDGVPGYSARRPALARFRRADYLAPHDLPLATAVRRRLAERLGETVASRADGRICMLTQLRIGGVSFNPITLYYAYDRAGRLRALLGEVTNTPWGERESYACDVTPERHLHAACFDKTLHVSPFNPMDMRYRWRFNTPDARLMMHMEAWRDERRHFDATLTLDARPATRGALLAALARQPWQSLATLAAIHWQALRLWLKRVPIHDHPGGRQPPGKRPEESSS
ncbi:MULTISPECIES: DUF1365 domain-containing protein [Modicisalibacter]|uniref:DUF1365 domain-containing protein n=1 Tax=Modicisalibacter TaxID=574347 RepID=UPI00100A93B4|nr:MULTISPECIES: DUF1365 domain-containing protein [Halomonadaceae]MBZ9558899.1 DUF1365 domain-containing protein [Modicisalibacter sp. R2A 31.J]MBZ9575209.1 DUF1365 domain-containing protein [Modicisalibacter sp. MOD 31.J]